MPYFLDMQYNSDYHEIVILYWTMRSTDGLPVECLVNKEIFWITAPEPVDQFEIEPEIRQVQEALRFPLHTISKNVYFVRFCLPYFLLLNCILYCKT